MNFIDPADTSGRLNKGLSGLIGRLDFDSTSSTENWAKEKTLGTSYSGFVGADYSSSQDQIAALYLSDDASEIFHI